MNSYNCIFERKFLLFFSKNTCENKQATPSSIPVSIEPMICLSMYLQNNVNNKKSFEAFPMLFLVSPQFNLLSTLIWS